TPLKSEALVRLLAADLVGEAPTRRSLEALRADVAELQARLDESEASAAALPHREKYLRLVNAFLRRLLDLHLELVDEVEREFDSPRVRGVAEGGEQKPVRPVLGETPGVGEDDLN